MSRDRLDTALQAAVTEGLLPSGTRRPDDNSRPWPVVLLTGLGAWFAAVPLLFVVGLLFGDSLRQGPVLYVVGVLVLAAALVVLRSQDLPHFVEQLAVPALLVGGGSLAVALHRDLPAQAAFACLCLLAIALALMIERPWLRVLLGAAGAGMLVLACLPVRWTGAHRLLIFWCAWHASLAAWLIGGRIQAGLIGQPTAARWAAAVEPLRAGWVLLTLAGLAIWSGMTFLVGGASGGFVNEVAHELTRQAAQGYDMLMMQAGSVLLALAAAGWAALRWPALRSVVNGGIALALAGLAWFMPALGAALLVLAVCSTGARWRLALAAAVAAAWIIGAFYYALSWPLASKALLLVGIGVALGVLAWLAARAHHGERLMPPVPSTAAGRSLRAGIVLSVVGVLAVANIGIREKERLIAQGQPIFVELAPVDPRSLMQGDYMRLDFRLPAEARSKRSGLLGSQRPHVIARRDQRGVATLLRIDESTPLQPDELRLELTPSDGRWTLVTNAWFFKEGEAARWAGAKYGEFRVDAGGRALLVGLRGAALEPL